MERLAQEDGGRHLLELVSEEKESSLLIPCADDAIAPYWGEPSCAKSSRKGQRLSTAK
jgi:hypothetical protein